MSNKDEVRVNFRVDKDIRDNFHKACVSQDLTSSQVLRKFMREYAEKHNKNQPDKA